MKIRTDYVTNSSSSSFVLLLAYTRDGEQYPLCDQQDVNWNDDSMPVLEDGELKYTYFSFDDPDEENEVVVDSVTDLAAILYFNDSSEPADLSVISPIFSFLIGKLSARKLIKALKEKEGFEELEDIDPSDYDDKDELREEIIGILEGALAELDYYSDLSDEETLEGYKKLVNKVASLSDIERIDACLTEHNWDEFTNIYSERLSAFAEEHPFNAVAEDDPEYDEALRFWHEVMKNEVLMGDEITYESLAELVAKTLASGECYDMIPRSVSSSKVITYNVTE